MLTDISLNVRVRKSITVFTAHWSKEPSDHEIYFNLQQMNHAALYFPSNWYFIIGMNFFTQIIHLAQYYFLLIFFETFMEVTG